jgi:hypothetical protein
MGVSDLYVESSAQVVMDTNTDLIYIGGGQRALNQAKNEVLDWKTG